MMRTSDAARMPTQTCAPSGEAEGVRLLWTSGWDSTFQLLRLLLQHRLPVTPYYLEDATRASTGTELEAIARITAALHAWYPHTRALLRPLRRFPVAGLAPDPAIDDALREVRTRTYIGSQYAWLPMFCKQHGLDGIEMSVHVDDKVQALLSSRVAAFEQAGAYRSVRVAGGQAGTPEYTLFRYFSFPLFSIDKRAMQREARLAGWEPLMEMTWFCHRPLRGRPCGVCAPCVYTIEEGLGWRVPRARRALSFVYRTFARPLKPPLRQALASLRGRRA